MNPIRPAQRQDAGRMAEIEIFNYRLFFYPIFRNDAFYFDELQVSRMLEDEQDAFVYDDGVVKGFIRMDGTEVRKLFVEPVLQGQGIGAALLEYAIREKNANSLWALERNVRAIRFYQRHGFAVTGERKLEDDTEEYLIKMERK